jgi:hypothetical protein
VLDELATEARQVAGEILTRSITGHVTQAMTELPASRGEGDQRWWIARST